MLERPIPFEKEGKPAARDSQQGPPAVSMQLSCRVAVTVCQPHSSCKATAPSTGWAELPWCTLLMALGLLRFQASSILGGKQLLL